MRPRLEAQHEDEGGRDEGEAEDTWLGLGLELGLGLRLRLGLGLGLGAAEDTVEYEQHAVGQGEHRRQRHL